ncbi:protein MpASHR3 [Marchantia polymorpha subsp. ruderalis]|uniref:Histone-lysine N-methyltransferase n=2 Tax=Marchantia polymorpha TaxID=3197 RepID=A0AAF6BU07_MARPO|nr:hypothetical protein MARPO_0045s0061 [Marchantia polymorpha]BBN15491.1 hypothetical protein Mp_6g20020 [Marchantia polymorpha subsp. ruderalis]|eukprot:PTQ39397.1 hypothetical protein MARPO_0045s0061 [Marchantia polymorpha]
MGKRKHERMEISRKEKHPRLECCDDQDEEKIWNFVCDDTNVQLEFVGQGRDFDSLHSSEEDVAQSTVISAGRDISLSGSTSPQEFTTLTTRKRAFVEDFVPSSRKKVSRSPVLNSPNGRTKSKSRVSSEELQNSPDGAGAVITESNGVLLDGRTSSSEVDGPLAPAALEFPSSELECLSCKLRIHQCEVVSCSHKDCLLSYHLSCAKDLKDGIWRKKGNFTCPQHVCYACGGHRSGRLWRCEMCPTAVHEICCPWPADMTFFQDKPGWAICWRHSSDRRSTLDMQYKQITRNIKDVFRQLPLPENLEDFELSYEIQNDATNVDEPPPYTHIRRNEFLIKKKRDDSDDGVGCKCGEENMECGEDCECRVQSMSCSKDCVCKKVCTNRPYRKEKRLKIVKTLQCGWGAESAELIRKGEFIIEYIGEVINDAMCENRLWAMKGKGISKFYMCEIMKDFIIDATFKGNSSRFLNHSCQPNCKLEKWRVDGETRAGVFALRDIKLGEPLTYDYKYVEFGANVKCCCGAPKCRGAIGEKPSSKNCWSGNLKWGKRGVRGAI